MKVATAVVFLVVAATSLSTASFAADQGKPLPNNQKQVLTVSPDGQFLIDDSGRKVRQYLKSERAFVPLWVKDKHGVEFNPVHSNRLHMTGWHQCNCHSECIRWDEHGSCLQSIRECDMCPDEG